MTDSRTKYPTDAYLVTVTNNRTGASEHVAVNATGATDAQVAALHLMFQRHGWHHCSAALPAEMALRPIRSHEVRLAPAT